MKSGETIISEAKEIIQDNSLCGYMLHNPHKVLTERPILLSEERLHDSQIQVSLTPWILLTEDTDVVITPSWVVTMVDPITSVKNLYEEKINESNQVSFTEC
jgi:hypothetical protein